MAVRKLPSGNFQARLAGPDGMILSEVFGTKAEAQERVACWKREKREGRLQPNRAHLITVNQFFLDWFSDLEAETIDRNKSGWRRTQRQLYRDYIEPEMGNYKLKDVNPQIVKRVLNGVAQAGKSAQLQLHVFALLRKMFGDAVENYQILQSNPATRKIKPRVPVREAAHLSVAQSAALLNFVRNERYGRAVHIQFLLGLRCGELQALTWDDVDLERGRVTIRSTYVRKTKVIRPYPKGGRHHSVPIPADLLPILVTAKAEATCEFVASVDGKGMLSYEHYFRTLRRYCRELDLPEIGTHGLRHSTSEFYLSNGASRDDLRQLFDHSSLAVTDRYVHGRGSNLEAVARRARLHLVKPEAPGSGSEPESTTKIDHAGVASGSGEC